MNSPESTVQSPPPGKFPRGLALQVGRALNSHLEPYCLPGRLEIAGSLRRGKAEVSDVEICYVSRVGDIRKHGEMFDAPGFHADMVLNEWLIDKLAQRLSADGQPTWGPLNKLAVHVSSGVPVDFFREPDARDWWRTLVIRTGPKEFNLKLIAGAKERGLFLHAYGRSFTGVVDNLPVRASSEKHFLELCGFDWLEPEERQ